MTAELIMRGISNLITLLLIILLVGDIIITGVKVMQQHKLWNLIKAGEVSYIRALNRYGEIHGYTEKCDEDDKDLSSEH